MGLLSKCSASASLFFISPPKSDPPPPPPRPALKSVPFLQGRVVVLEELTREVVESLGFPRTSSV